MVINFPLNISINRVIHLSHIIDQNIPKWPGDPAVELEPVAEISTDGYFLRRFSLGEHSATHINAPNSFGINGAGIETYPAESLIAPAIIIDVRQPAAVNPDYLLTVEDVLYWENQFGLVPCGSIVILFTGWQFKWADSQEFFNQDAAGKMHFPGFSRNATKFLLSERKIAGVGIDTHGVDSGQDDNFATNRQVLAQGGIVLENLTNLDQLPAQGTILVIGILRLRGGSGSPAAVMALVP
jgi:kynurenine formamidase